MPTGEEVDKFRWYAQYIRTIVAPLALFVKINVKGVTDSVNPAFRSKDAGNEVCSINCHQRGNKHGFMDNMSLLTRGRTLQSAIDKGIQTSGKNALKAPVSMPCSLVHDVIREQRLRDGVWLEDSYHVGTHPWRWWWAPGLLSLFPLCYIAGIPNNVFPPWYPA